ncbi:MAG: hypothetical protein ABII00_00250 [Elusimicrobiota bacterium]
MKTIGIMAACVALLVGQCWAQGEYPRGASLPDLNVGNPMDKVAESPDVPEVEGAPLEVGAGSAMTMGEVGGDVDIAESSLRIILGRPAKGESPREWTQCKEKLESAMRLLNVETRHPGMLQHEGFRDWKQFQGVKELFGSLEKEYDFDYLPKAGIPVDGAAKIIADHDKARIGRKVEAADVFMSVDIAETSLRIILEEPASGRAPRSLMTCGQRLDAAMRLMNVVMSFPGLLEGRYEFPFEWRQYEGTVALFGKLEKKYDFFE